MVEANRSGLASRIGRPILTRILDHRLGMDNTYDMDRVDYRKHITIESDKRGGKPCIRGLRVTVYEILDYLAAGMTEQKIVKDFPDLTIDDIRACLAFAADRERKLAALPSS